jgi:hypothetical protein
MDIAQCPPIMCADVNELVPVALRVGAFFIAKQIYPKRSTGVSHISRQSRLARKTFEYGVPPTGRSSTLRRGIDMLRLLLLIQKGG